MGDNIEEDPILQILVARSVVILAEYNESKECDYSRLTTPILEQLAAFATPPSIACSPKELQPRVILQHQYRINVFPFEGLLFLAVSLRNGCRGADWIQSLLEEIAVKFVEKYGTGADMPLFIIPYTMNDFSTMIAKIVEQKVEQITHSDAVVPDQGNLKDAIVINVDRTHSSDEKGSFQDLLPPLPLFSREYQQTLTIRRRVAWWKNSQLLTFAIVSMTLFLYVYLGYIL